MKYVMGIDIGTTSLKAAVFDEALNPVASVTKDYTLEVLGDCVEFDAEQYWVLVKEAIDELSASYEIYALSIDTQCETLIVTDENGKPLRKAIVWLDNRAAKQADEIRARFGEKKVYEVTGQPEITATWPAAKLLWMKENEPEILEKTKKIFLLEDYILYHLTGRFVTEQTLQSSTIYFDVTKRIWWKEMLDFIGVKEETLPEVFTSGVEIGAYQGIRIVTGAIDQIAGAIGAGIVKPGVISEMTGTTMVIFVPSEEMPAYNPESKMPCHLNYDGKYCLLMWTPTAGIALKWFKNNFCETFSFKELDQLAKEVPAGSAGLTFLPYLCGATMPKYDPDAKGVFYGLTMEHTRGHAVRSILEAVSCMLKSNLDYVGTDCTEIRTMGGGAQSPLWCQIKADMIGKDFVTLKNDETACLGSAILAGVAVGLFESVEKACDMAVATDKRYSPTGVDYTECYKRYCELDEKLF
ncbi:MAG: hypothetical protein IJC78_08205 [Clostridia bacterium]|nr:hypothetical protein [Clostridia bacterium]